MTSTLYGSIQRIVEDELGRRRTAELATVKEQHAHESDSDQDNYSCTVVLRNSGIVLKQVPVATGRIGSVSIPAVGELVLVQFLDGDVNAAVITGRLYDDADRPPPSKDGQAVLHLPVGAGEEDAVHLELLSGDERTAIVRLGKGLSLTVKDDDPVVKLEIGDSGATLEISRAGEVKLKSNANVSIEAQNNLELKGEQISVEASGQLTLKGATVNIN